MMQDDSTGPQEAKPQQNSSIKEMQQLIAEIARVLVDQPDAVTVEVIPEADTTMLRLRVAPTDVGKVIGKQGRTARSLRTILSAASMKFQHRFSLDIFEDDSSQRP
jgi:predicted RNA-binding protein YlqC (UPF0109 family)